MSVRISQGLVISSGAERIPCPIRIREITSETIRVSVLACCYEEDKPCIVQGADKDFICTDVTGSADYSAVVEITFSIWDKPPGLSGATKLLAKTLSGATITLVNDNQYTFNVSKAESLALTVRRGWYETWIERSGVKPRMTGAGWVQIIDTREQDV